MKLSKNDIISSLTCICDSEYYVTSKKIIFFARSQNTFNESWFKKFNKYKI